VQGWEKEHFLSQDRDSGEEENGSEKARGERRAMGKA